MRIVGVDPGKTSGIALAIDGKVVMTREAKSLYDLFHYLGNIKPDVLVVEDFIPGFRWRSRNANDPLKAVGVCELYAQIWEIKYITSSPSKLQTRKIKPRGMSPHIWSAQVHALGYKL